MVNGLLYVQVILSIKDCLPFDVYLDNIFIKTFIHFFKIKCHLKIISFLILITRNVTLQQSQSLKGHQMSDSLYEIFILQNSYTQTPESLIFNLYDFG